MESNNVKRSKRQKNEKIVVFVILVLCAKCNDSIHVSSDKSIFFYFYDLYTQTVLVLYAIVIGTIDTTGFKCFVHFMCNSH